MYGTVSRQSAGQKVSNVAVVCGCAAIAGVIGLVAYGTQPSALYSSTAVRPVAQISVGSVPAVRSAEAVPVYAVPVSATNEVSGVSHTGSVVEVASTMLPFALGVTAVAAFVASLLGRKQAPAMQPIAMAATSGERLVWLPGAQPPAHLTGQYPGDRGFDPLGLSKDPKVFERMRISEVFHGRLAMTGLVGCLLPELLFHKAAWFDLGDLDVNRFGVIALQIIAPLEYWRGNGGFTWNGGDCADRSYPGFDPLGLTTEDTKLREIKNGRLAMVAMLGFEVQYHTTGQSPLANLAAHLADPLHANIVTGGGQVAMFAATGNKDRPLWFPGGYSPAWLTGEYPGDRGFDVFGLASEPKTYARMRISEVFHGRLAMLAVVGAIFQEAVGKGAWYDGPSTAGMGLEQLGTAILLCGLPEYWRGNGGFTKDATDKSYPGFDPLKLTTDFTKEAEIKNGRLALTAIAGFFVQHLVTGKSPVENFLDHWYNPLGQNIAANLAHPAVAMFVTSGEKYRGTWFPNVKPPAYLTGEFPADRGFDPAGLSADPTNYARMRISEVFHGRLAMLAIVGCVFPEILGKAAWYDFGDYDVNRIGAAALQVIAPLEYWRGNGGFGWNGEDEGRDRSYPGFDPLGLTTFETKAAEIKNGRLAMMGMMGLEVQHHVTGQSPLQNLAAHFADPLGANIASSLSHSWPVAMLATSGHKEGLWFPGATPAPHLTGEYPADRGFDPLGLAADPTVYARMRAAEVFNGRVAMFGVLGCLVPELLGKGAWFQAGDVVDGTKVGFILMAIAAPTEYWRSQGGFGWDKGTWDRTYPGADPLKLTNDRNKCAEIKNGRLAMSAMLGFAAQYQVTGQSPLENLAAHLANPIGANIATNLAMF